MANIPSASGHRRSLTPVIILALLALAGAVGVILTTASDINLVQVEASGDLTSDERAYYEYVGPRLDRLVEEVDDVVAMVEERSRDILALTISGERIERLTDEVSTYGESNGIPERFGAIHDQILAATDVTSYTFDQARQALRTFNFSHMSDLVTDFQNAADELHRAQGSLQAIADGTEDAKWRKGNTILREHPVRDVSVANGEHHDEV